MFEEKSRSFWLPCGEEEAGRQGGRQQTGQRLPQGRGWTVGLRLGAGSRCLVMKLINKQLHKFYFALFKKKEKNRTSSGPGRA